MTAKIQGIVAEQGAALSVTLTRADGDLTGRNLLMHVRSLVGEITVKLVASTANGRLTVTSPTSAALLIPSDVMAAVSVTDAREMWGYDCESWTNSEDGRREWKGNFEITRDFTRDTEADEEDRLAGLVRYDSPQSLTDDQKTQARDNIGAGTGTGGGGSGDVVGPASAADDRIAAFDGVTGKLIKQGSVTATAVAAHIGSTSNPHSVTAAQVGADPAGTAAAAVVAHAGATDPHGDRSFATSAVSTHAALTTGVHGLGGASQLNVGTTAGTVAAGDHAHAGVYQPLATVLTNTTAAFTTAQETKLSGIETAADVTDAGNVGTAIDGATAKTTPVDADTMPLIDSAASNTLKNLSWANIKATAKAYFDTLYQAVLVSGTNIKTVNGTILLGSGDIAISASPAGSSNELQRNSGGAFAGATGVTWASNQLLITAQASGTIPAAIQGASGQSVALLRAQNSTGTELAAINQRGNIGTTGDTTTASLSLYDVANPTSGISMGGSGGSHQVNIYRLGVAAMSFQHGGLCVMSGNVLQVNNLISRWAGSITHLTADSSRAITLDDGNFQVFTNRGATAGWTRTIASSVAHAIVYRYKRIASFYMRLDPPNTFSWRRVDGTLTTAGKYLELGSNGAYVEFIVDHSNNEFILLAETGTITIEA